MIDLDLRTVPIPLTTGVGFDFSDKTLGRVDLSVEPVAGSAYTIIRAAENMVPLMDLPQGGYFTAYFGETEYLFQADYRDGSKRTGKGIENPLCWQGDT